MTGTNNMPNFQSSRIQIRILAVAIFIVFIISVTGCAGNYTLGDSTKMYCQAVDLQPTAPKTAALSQDADGSSIAPVEAPVDQ